jgi:DNA-binding NarL/FixJ family response regulator
LASQIFNATDIYTCAKDSILLQEFDIKTLSEFLQTPLSKDELEYINEKQKQKILKTDNGIKLNKSKEFKEHFTDIQNKFDRNLAIINAYLDGHTQVDIANYLNVSKSLVSKVVKNGDIAPGI